MIADGEKACEELASAWGDSPKAMTKAIRQVDEVRKKIKSRLEEAFERRAGTSVTVSNDQGWKIRFPSDRIIRILFGSEFSENSVKIQEI